MIALLSVLLLGACRPEPGEDAHPAPEPHAEEEAAVTLSGEAVAAAQIEVVEAERGALAAELSLSGRIALDPRREALLSAWIGGQIEDIEVQPGDGVRSGAVLAMVRSPDLGEAVAAYRSAQAADVAADARLERLQKLEAEGVTSQAQSREAEAIHAEAEGALGAARERLVVLGVDPQHGDVHAGERYASRVAIRSPLAGKVLAVEAAVGQMVAPGDPLFHIGDLDVVWLLLEVYERDLGAIHPEQPVRFAVPAWPGEVFLGAVARIGDVVEAESRTIEVRAAVSNPEHRLKPGMFATATLPIPAAPAGAPQGLVLPLGALQTVDGREAVFVQQAPGRFEARPVRILERSAGQVLLAEGEGIAAGEAVVVEGAFVLRGEIEKAEGGHGHGH